MLLAMESACELKRHVIKKQFPGRSFAQLFSRYHFLRMKSTTPQKYIEELKVKLIIVDLKDGTVSHLKASHSCNRRIKRVRPGDPCCHTIIKLKPNKLWT